MATNLRDKGYSSSMDNYKQQQEKKRKKEEQERNRQAIIRKNKEAKEGPVSTQRLTLPKAEAPVSTQRMGTVNNRASSVYGPTDPRKTKFDNSPTLQKLYKTYDNYLAGKMMTDSGYTRSDTDPDVLKSQRARLGAYESALPNIMDNLETKQKQAEPAIKMISDYNQLSENIKRRESNLKFLGHQLQTGKISWEDYDKAYKSYIEAIDKSNLIYNAMQDPMASASLGEYNSAIDGFNQYFSDYGKYYTEAAAHQKYEDDRISKVRPMDEIQAEKDQVLQTITDLEKRQDELGHSTGKIASTQISGVMPWALEKAMNDQEESKRVGQQIDYLRQYLALLDDEMESARYKKWSGFLTQNVPVSAQRANEKQNLLEKHESFMGKMDDIIESTKETGHVSGGARKWAWQRRSEMDSDQGMTDWMTDEEKATYESLEQYGPGIQQEYFDELREMNLNTRQRLTEEKAIRKSMHGAGVASIGPNIMSILLSPYRAASYIGQAADYLGDRKLTKDASYNRAVYWTNAVRTQTGADIDEWLGPKAEKWGVKWGSFGYQTLMSMGDFMYNMALTGGLGLDKGGIALYEGGDRSARAVAAWKAYKTSENLSLALMGTQAAADAVMQNMDRGLTDGQAFALGTLSGLIEVLTEKVSIENLMEGLGDKSKLLYLLKNIVAEGSEEVASDLLNLLTDAWIAKDQSEWHQSVLQYKKNHPGATDEEALKAVWADQAKQTAMSGLGGALSGGFMAGLTLGGNYIQSYKENNKLLTSPENINNVISSGMEMKEGSEAYKAAQALQASLDAGEKISAKQVKSASKTISEAQLTDRQNVRELVRQAEKYEGSKSLATDMRKKLAKGQDATVKEVRALQSALETEIATDPENVQPLVKAGLESRQGSEAYQAATELQSKIESGTKLTLKEVARAQQIIIDDYVSDVQSDTPEVVGKRIANNTEALTQAANEVIEYGTKSQGVKANALLGQIKNGTVDAKTAGEVFLQAEKIYNASQAQVTRTLSPREVTADMDEFDRSAAEIGVSEQDAARTKSVMKALGIEGVYKNISDSRINAYYDKSTGKVVINANAQNPGISVIAHEVTHSLEGTASYSKLADMILKKTKTYSIMADLVAKYKEAGIDLDSEGVRSELVAEYVENKLLTDQEAINDLVKQNRSAAEWFRDKIDSLLAKLGNEQAQERQFLKQAREYYAKALGERDASREAKGKIEEKRGTKAELPSKADTTELRKEGFEVKDKAVSFNLSTYRGSDIYTDQQTVARQIASAIGVSEETANRYINSIRNVAYIISQDSALDYTSAEGLSAFVSNVEYGGSFDFTTLCAKRRYMTGTMAAIQNNFDTKGLTAEEFLTIRKMLEDKGYQVSCPMCYVEGSRAKLAEYAEQFLKTLPKDSRPTVSQLTDPVKLEQMRTQNPEMYKAWESYLNKLNQRKPKMYQARTAYKGEIIDNFTRNGEVMTNAVEEKNRNGGIRFQSFSDFEAVHLLDNMQAIYDMSRVGLAGQAYTKMIDYVMAMGGTGLKINMSLVAKGVDANGRIILDETAGMTEAEVERARNAYSEPVEGMDEETRIALRDSFSRNVGTILVVFDDAQLRAALADDRIDFIIPYHRSQWAKAQHYLMGMPQGAMDYTLQQNEKSMETGKRVDKNLVPADYWESWMTGKQAAEAYLQKCFETGRVPKFSRLLHQNADGSYSLQKNGSTDGYWKLLSDYKMYDNNGNYAPQEAVRPVFDDNTLTDILNREEGGESYPVAQEVVDQFMAIKEKRKGREVRLQDYVGKKEAQRLKLEYAQSQKQRTNIKNKNALMEQSAEEMNKRYQYSISPKQDTTYLKAVESGDTETAQRMVDEAARKAGYDYVRYTRNAGSAWNNKNLLQMFVDRDGAEMARGYGDYQYVANGTGAIDVNSILPALRDAWAEFADENGYDTSISDVELDPDDIVMSAGVWDDADFVTWLFDRGFFDQYTKDAVPAIRTEDGLIVFGEDNNRVKSADPVTYDSSGNPIPLSQRFNPENPDIRYSVSKKQDGGLSLPVAQEISSAKTSIKQVPALFTDSRTKFGKVNVDIGGGKYDLATDYLKERGTQNLVFDPYNRDRSTNRATLQYLQDGNRADTATCANVLNVIAEPEARENVILETAKAIKDDGTAYFMVYEGDGSGNGKRTSAGWQNNMKTADYVSEIEQYFDNVERKGKLIIATNPKADLPQASWEVQPGEGIRYSVSKKGPQTESELIDSVIDPAEAVKADIQDAIGSYVDSVDMTKDIPGREAIRTTSKGKTRDSDNGRFLYRKMIDSGEAVTRLGRYSNDKYLYPYFNMARASSNAAISMIQNAQTDVMGRRVGDSLNDIFSGIRAKGDEYYTDLQLYLYHLHNIARMSRANPGAVQTAMDELETWRSENPELARMTDDQVKRLAYDPTSYYQDQARVGAELIQRVEIAEAIKNKPIFGYEVSAETSRDAAEKLREKLEQTEGFEEDVEKIRKYIDNLMRYRIDSGLFTEENYEKLKKIYPDYVPVFYEYETESKKGRAEKRTEIGSTVGRAQGVATETPIVPLHKALAQQTLSAVREGSKNRFGQRLLDKQNLSRNMIKSIDTLTPDFNEENFDQPSEKRKNTFVVRQDGKRYEMTLGKDLYEAIDVLSPDIKDTHKLIDLYHKAFDLFKAGVTGYNPVFAVKNPIRDLQDAGLYSKDLSEFLKQYPKTVKEIRKGGKYWQLYQAMGGLYSSVFDYNKGELDEHSWFRRKTLDRIEAANMAVEQMPRLAEFMATIKKAEARGEVTMDDLMEAMHNAADVTVNFGRSGKWGQWLNKNWLPFFNPGIQGADKFVRRFTETKGAKEWLTLTGKAALFGVVPAILNKLLWGKRKDWDELKQSDRDNYYLFPIPWKDGVWLRLPKGRALALFGMATDRIIQGKDADWASFITTGYSNLGPSDPLKTNFLSPWIDADLFNKDNPGKTWYGGQIESQRLQGLKPGERYDTSTDLISKWLGNTLNLSPKKINYILDQYTGVIGDIALPWLSDKGFKGIFSNAFTVDSVTSNRLSSEFYDMKDQLNYAQSDPDAGPVDDLLYEFWYQQNSAVSAINKEITRIEEDPELSAKEKRELTRLQYALRNEVMRNALDIMKDYANGEPSTANAVNAYFKSRGVDLSKNSVEELGRLYDDGYDVIPSAPPSKLKVMGAEYDLSGDEKAAWKRTWTELTGVDKFVQSPEFKQADDDTKAKMLDRLYEYARQQTNKEITEYFWESKDKWPDKVTEYVESGHTTAEAIYAHATGTLDGVLSGKYDSVQSGVEAKAEAAAAKEAKEATEAKYEGQTFTFNNQQKSWDDLSGTQKKIVQSRDAISEDPNADLSDIIGYGNATKKLAQYQEAREAGISNEAYIDALQAIDDADDGNGNYNQKEAKAGLEQMISEGKISEKDAGKIWKIITGGADKNNPFPVGAIGPIGLKLPRIG